MCGFIFGYTLKKKAADAVHVFWISLQAVIPGVTEHEDYSLLG
jgi:hypothetical protein